MKRFRKLERARDEQHDSPGTGATPKRFEAIERAKQRDGTPAANPFAPPAPPDVPVQLELHDKYSAQVEEARRVREARATRQLTELEAEVAAREEPRHEPNILDVLAAGAAIGPLARIGAEKRLWLVIAALLALWFVVGLSVSPAAGIGVVGALAIGLGLRGWSTCRPS